MSKQCPVVSHADDTVRQCIYVDGHGGDHEFPCNNRDRSDDIRIRVLKDNNAQLEATLAAWRTTIERARALLVMACGESAPYVRVMLKEIDLALSTTTAGADLLSRLQAAEKDSKRLDWLQGQIDPVKQAQNGGFVVQTLEIRNNARWREAVDAAMEPSNPK